MAPERVPVVVLLDSLQRPGGGERLALEGARRLDKERFAPTLCLTRWSDAFDREEPARSMLAGLREEGVGVLPLRRRGRFDLLAWRPLLSHLRSRRVQVLHAHLFGSNVWASLIGTVARVPAVVAHEHMWAYTGSRLRALIDRWVIARLSDAFVAVSAEGRERMVRVERIPEDDIVLIPNGIPPVGPGEGERVRAELGVPAGAPLIGSVGHLRSEKAFEVLIEAAGFLRVAHPEARVLIVGEGPCRGELERLRADLGLDDRVLLPGAREDIADVLDALDIAVCCSDFEGGPLSVMEYMSAALPVVATRVGGLPELVVEGETGLLVEPRDPPALAAALGELLTDPARAAELGSSGRDLQRREHDIDVWIGRIEGMYDRLLA